MFYEKTVLGNGVTVITEHIEGVRSIALGMWVRVGNRDESPEVYGISHFMEHMLFKGTPTRSASDISIAFDAIGAEMNAFTSREYTCFYSRFIDEHLPQAFEILSDMIVNASFSHETIVPEREVVIEEIARSEDTPEDQVYDLFADAMFPTHPLGRPVLGTREIVGGLDTPQMRAYHDAHYTSGNLTVVACGNVEHAEAVELAQSWLSGMVEGPRLERPRQQETERRRLACIQKETEQAHLLYGFPSLAMDDARRYACSILDAVLGGGMSSRLFTEIREKRGLVYSVYTSSQMHEDAGSFAVYAGSRPENLPQVLEVTRAELAKMAQEGPSQEEVDRARELVCGNFVLGMESTRPHMVRLGRMATCGLPLLSVDDTLANYREVSRGDVAQAAGELLVQEPTIAVISPYGQEEIERML